MGVLQNACRERTGVYRIWGGTILNSAYPQGTVGNWHLTGMQRNLTAGEAINDDKTGVPDGARHPAAWIMPQKPGRVAARNEALPTLTTTGAIAGGRNIVGEATPALSATATGQLVVSGVGAATLALTTTGSIVAALAAEGSASPAITASSGTATAIGHMAASTSMSISPSLTRYAVGHLEGNVDIGAVALGAETFSTYLLDETDIETGLTLRQALRVVTAAVAGKVSGAETTTITFRNTADTADRITATVDASGNRTGVTLNVS